MSYVLSWDLIIRKHSLYLFNMCFYHDILLPVIKAIKLFGRLGPGEITHKMMRDYFYSLT